MILFLDNLDSFTYNIVRKIRKNIVNTIFLNLKNFKLKFKKKIIIIGPGAKNNINSNINTLMIDKFIFKKFFIGICLGHQIIGEYFGSKIIKLNKIFHGMLKIVTIYFKKYKIFIKKKLIKYNSLSCKKIFNLKIFNKNMEILYIKNLNLKIKCIQLHPESILSNKNFIL